MAVEYGWFSLVMGRINPLLEGSRAQTDQGVWTNERAAVLQFLCGSARSIKPSGGGFITQRPKYYPCRKLSLMRRCRIVMYYFPLNFNILQDAQVRHRAIQRDAAHVQ